MSESGAPRRTGTGDLPGHLVVRGVSHLLHDRAAEPDQPRPRTFEVAATERYLELKREALEELYAGDPAVKGPDGGG